VSDPRFYPAVAVLILMERREMIQVADKPTFRPCAEVRMAGNSVEAVTWLFQATWLFQV
jgi:hypothetical protein